MLSLSELEAVLDVRAYKPGWTFTAYVGDTTRQVMLQVRADLPNSYEPEETVPLDIRSPVPGFALESVLAFDKWLVWRLQQVEIHECLEWYRRPRARREHGFTPVFNPHRDGADRDQWPITEKDAVG